jgi:hypothetical protein
MSENPNQPAPAPPGTLDVAVPADSQTSFSAMGALPVDGPARGDTAGAAATPSAPPPPAAPADEDDFSPQPWLSSRFVRTGIFAATLVAVVTIALLFSRWFRTDDASALIVVGLPADYDGALVVVSGPALRNDLSATLSAAENMILRFHVPPGVYHVTATKPGKPVKETDSDPKRPLIPSMIWWPFDAPASVTSPSSRPAKP